MAEEDKNRVYTYNIPENFTDSGRIFGFKKRNILEAAIAIIITANIVSVFPFVIKVKLIVLMVLCIGVGALFLKGVYNKSITEWLISVIIFKKNSKKLHFRTVKEDKKRSASEIAGYQNRSYAEIALNKIYNQVATKGKGVKNGEERDIAKEIRTKLGI